MDLKVLKMVVLQKGKELLAMYQRVLPRNVKLYFSQFQNTFQFNSTKFIAISDINLEIFLYSKSSDRVKHNTGFP